jgi:hypothetical protein
MTIVRLTEDDYEDALALLSFNTLDAADVEVIIDLEESEAQELSRSGRTDTRCRQSGRELTLLAPTYSALDE